MPEQGYSYAETAASLCIGVETVRTHSARIRCKLGVKSRHELVAHLIKAATWRTASPSRSVGLSLSISPLKGDKDHP